MYIDQAGYPRSISIFWRSGSVRRALVASGAPIEFLVWREQRPSCFRIQQLDLFHVESLNSLWTNSYAAKQYPRLTSDHSWRRSVLSGFLDVFLRGSFTYTCKCALRHRLATEAFTIELLARAARNSRYAEGSCEFLVIQS